MATISPQDMHIKDVLIPLNEKTRMGIYIKSTKSEKVKIFRFSCLHAQYLVWRWKQGRIIKYKVKHSGCRSRCKLTKNAPCCDLRKAAIDNINRFTSEAVLMYAIEEFHEFLHFAAARFFSTVKIKWKR